MNSMLGIEVKYNAWVPKDKGILTDKHGNVVGVIDLESPWIKFKKLLNMGSDTE